MRKESGPSLGQIASIPVDASTLITKVKRELGVGDEELSALAGTHLKNAVPGQPAPDTVMAAAARVREELVLEFHNPRNWRGPTARQRESALRTRSVDCIKHLDEIAVTALAVATWTRKKRIDRVTPTEPTVNIQATPEFSRKKPSRELLIIKDETEQIAIANRLSTDNRCRFPTTGSPLVISEHQFQEIQDLGSALFGLGGVLNGITMVTRDFIASGNRETGLLINHATDSFTGREKELITSGDNPSLLAKVDLMIDVGGHIQIAEIEAGSKVAGLGFGHFTEQIIEGPHPNVLGASRGLKMIIEYWQTIVGQSFPRMGFVVTSPFYLPETKYLLSALKKEGIDCLAINADPKARINKEPPQTDFLFNLPINAPRLWKNLWLSGEVNVVLPPRPILDQKTILALLSNVDEDPAIENALRERIDADKLALLREHLPKTWFLPPQKGAPNTTGGLIFKALGSSGSKGVEDSRERLQLKINPDSPVVAQSKVEQASYNGLFARITAFLSPFGIITMPVTLSENPIVHGGINSYQTTFQVSK